MSYIPPISASSFYQKSQGNYRKRVYEKKSDSFNDIIPYKISNLLAGPPLTWKTFRKQADALHFSSVHKHKLMTFVFETGTTRLFLAAHPEIFWFYDAQKPLHYRSSYEVIPENTVCKLYFDIEFNKTLNPNKDGHKMVTDFISFIIFYLKDKLDVNCSDTDVLNLDSTTDIKFSCHLIFNLPGVCFANNNQVGNFVNYVCNEITLMRENKVKPTVVSTVDCCELFVEDKKGNMALFCDRSVYSRNRHFRLYMSSKYGKGVPLVLSPINKFKPQTINDNYEREIFYASLITYLPYDYEKIKVINFDYFANGKPKEKLNSSTEYIPRNPSDNSPNPFKGVDDFINSVVAPGKIYRSSYFSSSNIICYDIVGNRFCGKIGRPHKQNNVKYIVDLNDGIYYQKCHDFDCKDYKSEKKPLPTDLQLVNMTGENIKLGTFVTSEGSPPKKPSLERFPSCGLADEEIINHLAENGN